MRSVVFGIGLMRPVTNAEGVHLDADGNTVTQGGDAVAMEALTIEQGSKGRPAYDWKWA